MRPIISPDFTNTTTASRPRQTISAQPAVGTRRFVGQGENGFQQSFGQCKPALRCVPLKAFCAFKRQRFERTAAPEIVCTDHFNGAGRVSFSRPVSIKNSMPVCVKTDPLSKPSDRSARIPAEQSMLFAAMGHEKSELVDIVQDGPLLVAPDGPTSS
jgi:hypothetical protein